MLLPQLSNLGMEEEADVNRWLGAPPGKSYGLHRTTARADQHAEELQQPNKLTNALPLLAWEDCGLEDHASRLYLKVSFEPVPKN